MIMWTRWQEGQRKAAHNLPNGQDKVLTEQILADIAKREPLLRTTKDTKLCRAMIIYILK